MSAASRRGFLKRIGSGALAGYGPVILKATNKSGSARPILGSGEHTYEAYHDWGQLPSSIKYGNTHGVRVDHHGHVYIFHTVNAASESTDAMVVFDRQGKFVKSWGSQYKGGAHGLHIQQEGKQEFLYLCDIKRSIVAKTTLDGEEIFSFGYPKESAAYKQDKDGKPLTKYVPTNLAIAPNGDIFVGDGYGSSYINQYNSKGEFIRTFGGKGSEPGKLNCPHGIILDDRGPNPILLVADRSNHRLQKFSLNGQHLGFVEGVQLPCHFHFYKGEMVVPDLAAHVLVMSRDNQVIVDLGDDSAANTWRNLRTETRDHFVPGKFICPHSACFDHEGNIFVVEWVEVGRVTKLRKVA